MGDKRNLEIWNSSMNLTVMVYNFVKKLPKDEQFNLVDQLRRCAVSIPSNIAEGNDRGSNKDFIRFLYISLGSLSELETQLLLTEKIGYVNYEEIEEILLLCSEIGKKINALIKRIS